MYEDFASSSKKCGGNYSKGQLKDLDESNPNCVK